MDRVTDPTLLEELKKNPRAGPRPLSKTDYLKRQANRAKPADIVLAVPPPPEKFRGGFRADICRQISSLKRTIRLCVTEKEKEKFKLEIRTLRKEEKKYYKDRKKSAFEANNVKDANM